MFATQVLPDTALDEQPKKENNSEIVGYLKVGDEEHVITKGDTKIGRDSNLCSVVIDHFSISKLHAVIESEGPDDSFIYDAGSTNKTKLGKMCLRPNCRYKIDNKSVITLGNVLAKFVIPPVAKIKSLEITIPPDSDDNEKDSFDIFEVATQVEPVQINKFQKPPVSFKLFKVPAQPKAFSTPVPSTSFAEPESSQVQYFYGTDDSDIFSLSTQCQLPSPCEQEKIKSLLNDGQDDVLCDFMLLHSPQGQILMKRTEIKTEPNKDIFEAETQAQLPEDIVTQSIPAVMNVTCIAESLNKENIKSKEVLEISLDDREEDENLIMTQKFPNMSSSTVEKTKTIKTEKNSVLPAELQSLIVEESSDEDTQPYSVSLENSIQGNQDNNLVNIQGYKLKNINEKDLKKSFASSPVPSSWNLSQRNQNVDVISTQKFSLSNESNNKDQEEDLIIVQRIDSPRVVSPNFLSLNSTQRNENDDLISTQKFNQSNSSKYQKEEDFISTQKLNLPKERSREISPSLLSLTFTQREDEDNNSTQLFDKKVEVVGESSGDETESDLEIEAKNIKINIEFVETKNEESKTESIAGTSDTSNQSYVFQLGDDKDSDETDYEGNKSSLINSRELGAQNSDLSNSSEKSLEVSPSQDIGKKSDGNEEKQSKNQSSFKVQRLEVEVSAFIDENIDGRIKRGRSSGNRLEVIPLKKAKTNMTDTCGNRFSKLLKSNELYGMNSEKSVLSSNYDKGNFAKPTIRISAGENRKQKSGRNKVENKKFQIAKKVHDIPASQDIPVEPKFTENRITRILRSRRSLIEFANPIDVEVKHRRSKREVCSKCVHVVFTGFESEALENIIIDLGGKKTNDLFLADVLVTDRIRRTVKFLCAIGLGMPITSLEWLTDSQKENKFLNPWNYILKKECAENGDFDLRMSLERSKKTKLFKGYSVFATKSTKPPVKDLLMIVECCGGIPLYARPEIWPKKTIFVSCIEDQQSWPGESFRNVKLVHYEFILSGVLKQQIDFKTYKLS